MTVSRHIGDDEDWKTDEIRRIHALIRNGDFQVGERLGSERELAKQLGVSRATLRNALAAMEQHHEIKRLIGRNGGVYVSDGRFERNINTEESLPAIVRRQGGILSSSVVSAAIAAASPSDMRMLKLPHESTIFNVVRLRRVDERPLSLEISHLPTALFPQFLSKDLTEPFYSIFDRYYEVRPGSVEEVLEPILSDELESKLLEISVGTPLMKIKRIAISEQGVPFERAIDVYIASRMRFTMHHSGYVRLSAATAEGSKARSVSVD